MIKTLVVVGSWLACFIGACLPGLAQTNPGWSLVWSDEFNQPDGSSPDPTHWVFETGGGGWGNGELEYYTTRTNNARIVGGNLVIQAAQENYMGSSYTSARLKTQGKWSWQYGRMEARIKIPRGQGIWPAFWMLGDNITNVGWPTCGEIDIMENIGREPSLVHGTVHGPGYSGGNAIGGPAALPGNPTFADGYHLYAVEWTTNQIKWFVDGYQYFSVNSASLPAGASWVYTRPQFLLLNVAVGGAWPGYPDTNSTFPQQMLVDYVRVYAATNLPPGRTNLLGNAGFESPGLANWTTAGAGFNTLQENIANVQVHTDTNGFKVFGQFNGGTNYSGAYQDVPAVPGESFNASGWACTSMADEIAGANAAWLELTFHDASQKTLSLYRSAIINTGTPPGLWLDLAVTNHLDPTTYAPLGAVTNLVAPANTHFARCRMVFLQMANAIGSVYFDDLQLASGGAVQFPVPVALTHTGGTLSLAFATYLNLPYQVNWKNLLSDPKWAALTNFSGTGGGERIPLGLQASSGFYSVTRLCN
jgi:beta-glucanase (GH16 family)